MQAATTGGARTRLTPHPTSAAAARRFVRDVLHRTTPAAAPMIEDAVLICTDELVTNAIVHVAADIEVVVRSDGAVVRVEVHDASRRPPLRRVADPDDDTGRGLELVEALSDRWGVDALEDGAGKAVWFEVEEARAAF